MLHGEIIIAAVQSDKVVQLVSVPGCHGATEVAPSQSVEGQLSVLVDENALDWPR